MLNKKEKRDIVEPKINIDIFNMQNLYESKITLLQTFK